MAVRSKILLGIEQHPGFITGGLCRDIVERVFLEKWNNKTIYIYTHVSSMQLVSLIVDQNKGGESGCSFGSYEDRSEVLPRKGQGLLALHS